MHDPLHDARVAADVAELQRRHRRPDHRLGPRPRRAPGRLRRRGAVVLLRTAERLAKEPVGALAAQQVRRPAGAARRLGAG